MSLNSDELALKQAGVRITAKACADEDGLMGLEPAIFDEEPLHKVMLLLMQWNYEPDEDTESAACMNAADYAQRELLMLHKAGFSVSPL